MCGIAGIIAKKSIEKMSASEMLKMCRMQKHRGPDDEGCVALEMQSNRIISVKEGDLIDCKALLGFERLSIQDLSEKGHQPMLNERQNVAIVFNGEIYNFKELEVNLLKAGHEIKGGTDTEVLLHMYLEYGIEKTLAELNGMFAFAIADMTINKIFIARDRVGIKPLYVANTDDAILFASEMKSFLPYHGFTVEINHEGLEEYMLFKSLMTSTLMKGVEQVEAGTLLTYDLYSNTVKKSKYFDIESYSRETEGITYKEAKESFWDVFQETVKRQIISDVHVGCQLSGGIDSSILCQQVSKAHNLYDTVSCKINCDQQSDAEYIDIVNKRLNANSHIKVIDEKCFIDSIIDVVWHFENPLSHTPAVGMYQISDSADKNDIRVLLSGEGADELFGGYKCFSKLAFSDNVVTEDDIVDNIVFRDGKASKAFLRSILLDIDPEKYYQQRIDYLKHFTGSNFDIQAKYEFTTQLGELLERQDKMAMAHSVENRVPFLDNEMIDFAWRVPESFLMNKEEKEGKYILKDVVSDIFGREFAFRKKVGFFIPGNMFLSSNMAFIKKVLDDIKKRDLVNSEVLEHWAESRLQIFGGLNTFESALFLKLFTFEIWCQLYVDRLSVEQCQLRYLYQ